MNSLREIKNQTATYFLRSRLNTYDIMKNCNCNYISIKHQILATFNIKKNQSERLYAFKRMELIEVKSLIWAHKGKLYIIYEKVMWILGILRFKSIHLLFGTFIHIIHMYISNDSNVILKYFHFVLLVVFF